MNSEKIVMKQSYIYELLIAGTYFVSNENLELEKIFDVKETDYILSKHKELFSVLKKLHHSFIFLIDLLADMQTVDDLTAFIDYLKNLSPEEIINLFFEEDFSDKKTFDLVMEDPQLFITRIINCLIDMDKHIFKERLLIDAIKLQSAEDWISSLVSEKGNLETLRTITGKSLTTFITADQYIFIPTLLNYIPVISDSIRSSRQLAAFPIDFADAKEVKISRERAVKTLKVLADTTRLEIIEKLLHKRYSGKELAEELKIKPASVSHHIQQIRESGMLFEYRDKNTKYFGINKRVLRQTQDYLENMKV